MPLLIHFFYHLIFKVWRQKRFRWFLKEVAPRSTDRMLDVGGYPWFWTSKPKVVNSIDVLNIDPVEWDPESAPDHEIRVLTADGCALQAADRSYDIGFSNSVIEHVGDWERQKAFAKEIRRVAEVLWVQTPAYECPIEPHYLAPFMHYFSVSWRKRLTRWFTVWGWFGRPTKQEIDSMAEMTRLIRYREMKELFPDCQILVERMFWVIPKSYIAFRPRVTSTATERSEKFPLATGS